MSDSNKFSNLCSNSGERVDADPLRRCPQAIPIDSAPSQTVTPSSDPHEPPRLMSNESRGDNTNVAKPDTNIGLDEFWAFYAQPGSMKAACTPPPANEFDEFLAEYNKNSATGRERDFEVPKMSQEYIRAVVGRVQARC